MRYYMPAAQPTTSVECPTGQSSLLVLPKGVSDNSDLMSVDDIPP